MKKLLLAVITCVSVSANADSLKFCQSVESLAGTVMSARQSGISLNQTLTVLRESNIDDFGVSMAIEAYESPLWSTKKNKAREISEFSNRWYLLCLKSTRGEA